MKRKNNFIFLLLLFLLFSSCSQGNPINAMMEGVSSIFVRNDKKVNDISKGNIMLAQAENKNTTNEELLDNEKAVNDSIVQSAFIIESYAYKSKFRRDPFISVLELQRMGMHELQIETAIYFGMIKGKLGKMALFKDATGMGYVFYEGQKIKDGVLLRIEADSVIFKIDEFGNIRNKIIKLQKDAPTKRK